ncbi:MAG: hypothetical protein AB7I42_22750 [Bradyrhizobium sp.]|uniref:hypothetical protein n=1 Tax=Bradyrhizobium sp. TaxID=376 RepID=UPI003D0C954C
MVRKATASIALLLVLSGCSAIMQRIQSDPVGATLVVVQTQWSAARETFYAEDAKRIEACIAAGREPRATCLAQRCETELCRQFRTEWDPMVTLSYNYALGSYERAKAAPTTVEAVRSVAKDTVGVLSLMQFADPDNADVYRALSAAIVAAMAKLPEEV